MRKPDGLAVDDAYDTKSGRTSFSGMSPLPFPSISEDLGTLQPLPPHHLTGLRRKSALPKAMSRLPASLDEDDEDEDLVDNLAALDEDENVPALVTPDVEEDGSDYLAVRSAAPLSSGSSSTQSEGRTPTPAPRHATSSPPLLALGATSGSHATRPQTRTSPRKGGASQPRSTTKYSTTPSLGGIKLSSGGSRLQAVAMAPSATHAMPVQRTRDALADLPSTNVLGVGKQKAGDYKGVGKLGGGEKRGRISSAVQMGISGS